jgi:hypothetical protein
MFKKIEPGNYCPLLRKPCIEHKCSWYTQVRGTNPNTGELIDGWGCAIAWMPMMQIETSQQARQAGAAVESFRNEMVRSNIENKQLYLDFINSNGILKSEVYPLPNPINMLESKEDDSGESK